jgi:hypothetical protein
MTDDDVKALRALADSAHPFLVTPSAARQMLAALEASQAERDTLAALLRDAMGTPVSPSVCMSGGTNYVNDPATSQDSDRNAARDGDVPSLQENAIPEAMGGRVLRGLDVPVLQDGTRGKDVAHPAPQPTKFSVCLPDGDPRIARVVYVDHKPGEIMLCIVVEPEHPAPAEPHWKRSEAC